MVMSFSLVATTKSVWLASGWGSSLSSYEAGKWISAPIPNSAAVYVTGFHQ
jgi:hypothetical protein